MRASSYSQATIRTRRRWLTSAARALSKGPWDVTENDLLRWVGAATWAPETRRSIYATLRSFYRWAIARGLLDASPAEALPRIRPSVPHPRPIPDPEWRDAAASTEDPRAQLAIRLAGRMGLRRAEVACIHRDHLFSDLHGWSLEVQGKGGRARSLPLPPDLAEEVLELTTGSGWLFPSARNSSGHMTPEHLGRLVARALPGRWTMHTLRHRAATAAYNGTTNILLVQQFLGHTSPATTQRYVAIDQGLMRTALDATL